jgi:hypothetical protein
MRPKVGDGRLFNKAKIYDFTSRMKHQRGGGSMKRWQRLVILSLVLVLSGFLTQSIYSQPPGFWEEERAYQAALQYIEQHRKSDVSIKVVDQAAAPVKGASVSYQQTTHDFFLGFGGDPTATPSDEPLGWKFLELIQGEWDLARPGKAKVVSGEKCRSGNCLHVKVNHDQNLWFNSDDVPIVANAPYEVTFWIKVIQAPASVAALEFGIAWAKGAIGTEWQKVGANLITPRLTVGDYTQLMIKTNAPTQATRARFRVWIDMEGASGDLEFYLDDISLVRSSSTQNLLRNPSFEETEAAAWALWSELCQSMNAWIAFEAWWSDIEPQPDVFQWEIADFRLGRILDRCPGAHFIQFFTFGGGLRHIPNWVEFKQLNDLVVFERFKQDLYDYVYHVVQRYADKVQWWTTLNELNTDEILGDLKITIEKAIEVDRVIALAIRDAHPQAKILLATSYFNPAYDSPTISPFEFAQRALRAGLQVDGIALEAYPFAKATPLFYQSYVRQLASLGKPVFIQETGYPSQPGPGEWMAWGKIFDETTQAAWVKYMIAIPYGTENVLGVLLVIAVDGRFPDWPFNTMGLFTREGRTKQAYDVYRQHIQRFTTVGSGNTNGQGQLAFRGFAGEYTVIVTAPDGRKVEQTIHVREKAENNFTIVLR